MYILQQRGSIKLKKISNKIAILLIIALSFSFLLTNGFTFFSVYKKMLDSAGIEAYGCANITTGLINQNVLVNALNGNEKAMDELGETVSWTIDHKHLFYQQYIVDKDGTLIAIDENAKNRGFTLTEQHPIDIQLIKEVFEMKHPVYSEIYDSNGERVLTGLAPIFEDGDPNKDVIAVNAIDFESSIVMKRTIETMGTSVFWSAIPLLLVLLVTVLFTSRMMKPIKVLSLKVEEISKGNLGSSIDFNRKDEIGILANSINLLVDRFKDVLGNVSVKTTTLATTSEELNASSFNLSEISNQNTRRLEEINNMAEKQSHHMGEINGLIQSLSDRIQKISEQLNNFSTVSQASVKEAAIGESVINQTNHQMESIDHKIDHLTESMIILQSKSSEINEITNLIIGISSQTNLLALNASIEAARAGEYGKGFAVVADEIRKLADQSADSTQKIDQLLTQIQSEIGKALEASKEGNTETKEGILKMNEAGDAFHHIASKIKEVSEDLTISSESVGSFSAELQEIAAAMTNVIELLDHTSNHTNEASGAIRNQNDSFNEIVEVTDSLTQLAEELRNKIGYFKM